MLVDHTTAVPRKVSLKMPLRKLSIIGVLALPLMFLGGCSTLSHAAVQDVGLVGVGEYLRGVTPQAKQQAQAQAIYTIASDVLAVNTGDATQVQALVDAELSGLNDPVLVLAIKPWVDLAVQTAADAASQQYPYKDTVVDAFTGIEEGAKLYLPAAIKLHIKLNAKSHAQTLLLKAARRPRP